MKTRFLVLTLATSFMISGYLDKQENWIRETFAGVLASKQVPGSVWEPRQGGPQAFTSLNIGNVVYENQLKNQELIEAAMKLSSMNPNHLILVDRIHVLNADFKPADLVDLALYPEISRSRDGLYLERAAAEALAELSAAARREGVILPVSSAYRSYNYQKVLFDDHIRRLGEEEASRQSAKPGTSQHQLGTAVDFGDVTNSFADTRAGKWMENNGGKFGWSLSYPKYSSSGYMWESWHWRWIGVDAVQLQDRFFGGSQHRMLLYLRENTTLREGF